MQQLHTIILYRYIIEARVKYDQYDTDHDEPEDTEVVVEHQELHRFVARRLQ